VHQPAKGNVIDNPQLKSFQDLGAPLWAWICWHLSWCPSYQPDLRRINAGNPPPPDPIQNWDGDYEL
jgi:hypothetical protein